MNFGAFPFPTCAPLKPRRNPVDVFGTANVAAGHRLREANSGCRYMEQFYYLRKATTVDPNELEDRRNLEQVISRVAFEQRTEKRIIREKIRQGVEQGMAAYDQDIEKRREKLRKLIILEETALTNEIVELASRGDEMRLEEMRAQAERLRKSREDERLAFVAAKRMQQYLSRCPDARDLSSVRIAKDVKHCNLVQMTENEARRRSEKELDMLWHRLMLKELEVKKLREIEDLRRKDLADKEVVDTLRKQVAGKEALREELKRIEIEEKKYLERLWNNIREEELRNLAREREKRERLKKDLEDQLIAAKRTLAERARQEAEIDRIFRNLNEAELAREKSILRESSQVLRREMLSYLKYLEDLRVEQARQDVLVNEIVEKSYKDTLARKDLALRKFQEVRQRRLREVLEGRTMQLEARREKEERERKRRNEEREILEKNLENERNLEVFERNRQRDRARKYGQDLKDQQNYTESMRKREKEEDERMYRDGLKRDDEYKKLTEELLKASDDVTPHAFKILIKECAARRDAEDKGLCYCPPPLPKDYP
ncbi:cilia- and flagella-associated protein 53-like [Cephus cinctus]|uniref:Cilia- and flagella-associated protein 53-like n=1 Tax=Cephus cinctus TaxID=211228 RepID=A0AAJ7BVY4_CEPCN|nr:cilia- and flagella-associated protein 53-like [Cephus cinctus]